VWAVRVCGQLVDDVDQPHCHDRDRDDAYGRLPERYERVPEHEQAVPGDQEADRHGVGHDLGIGGVGAQGWGKEDHDRERPQGQGQVAVPAVGLVRPGGDRSNGQDRECDLDGKLKYYEDLGHSRQDSLHEDISTTSSAICRLGWRQNASAA
jgi:hypothetical protein